MKQVLINNKKVNFITSNELEKYRVETLFDKEAETIEWIKRWNKEITVSKNMTFFDVGSNIGIYSIFAAALTATEVFSFEPVSNNYSSLFKNVNANNFKHLHIFNIALSNKSDLTDLYIPDLRNGNSGAQVGVSVNEDGKRFTPLKIEKVIRLTIDDLIYNFNFPVPDIIKIDVDGHEKEIIEGMEKILKNKIISSFLIEFNHDDSFVDLKKKFNQIGYDIDTSYDNLPNHSFIRRMKKGNSARNYIFVRK